MTDNLEPSNKEKVLLQRNMHMRYESSITNHSKDMANVKVFFAENGQTVQGKHYVLMTY